MPTTKKTHLAHLEAHAYEGNSAEYHFSLPFLLFQEDGRCIAYCPSLDITSSGENFNDAMANFYEMFQLHIEMCVELGTLKEDLLAHGWKVSKSGLTEPSLADVMKKQEVKNIEKSRLDYRRVFSPVQIPAPAI